MASAARALKTLSAPITSIVPTRKATNSGVCVGSIPALAGTSFLCARLPASASTGTISQ